MKRISLSLGLMPAALLCFSVLSVAQPVIDSWVSSEDNLTALQDFMWKMGLKYSLSPLPPLPYVENIQPASSPITTP